MTGSKANGEKKHSSEKKEEKILLSYGRFCKSMDSLRHYDSLQSVNEGKVSNANWYAVAAAGFLFSITKNPTLTLVVCMAVGLADIIYIFACYVTSLVNIERFYISFFYELLKTEEKEKWLPPVYHYMFIKEEDEEKSDVQKERRFTHHGTSYLKAIYYMIHLSIPFVVLIFTPAYVLFKRTNFYNYVSNLVPNWFGENKITSFPYHLILYIAICAGIFLGFAFFLFKAIGPMKTWLEKIYKMDKKKKHG
jgi:hypothetical protein